MQSSSRSADQTESTSQKKNPDGSYFGLSDWEIRQTGVYRWGTAQPGLQLPWEEIEQLNVYQYATLTYGNQW